MELVVDGQARAFEVVFDRHADAAFALAYRMCGRRSTAEDVVQDSFVRIHPRFDQLDAPAAYLRRTVTNACYSYHRRRGREEAYRERPRPVADPEHDDMWDALARLTPRRRAALVLRYYLDLSEADIADALGCRKGTVKSLTHRALADLRSVLER